MDEATASVDSNTDAAIQETIQRSLEKSTVLCIARKFIIHPPKFTHPSQPLTHPPDRLHTVMFYDRVLVLQDGEVVEYDTPLALLEKGVGGLFYRMCEKTGDLAGLRALAVEKEEKEEEEKEGNGGRGGGRGGEL